MRTITLTGRQIGWEQRQFWRNPPAAVFTVAFPLLFLVIFSAINAGDEVTVGGRTVAYTQYFVPAIVAFGVISACYTALAFTTTVRREAGVLRRKRATPLPIGVYLAGMIGSAILVAILLSAVVIVIGLTAYDITFPGRWLGLAVTILVGAAAFAALGLAMSTIVPNQEAAPAVINAVLFPLLFISGGFGPVADDSVLGRVGAVFPIRHFILGLHAVFDPAEGGSGIIGWRLAVVAGWGLIGAAVATRRFRWEPRGA